MPLNNSMLLTAALTAGLIANPLFAADDTNSALLQCRDYPPVKQSQTETDRLNQLEICMYPHGYVPKQDCTLGDHDKASCYVKANALLK